MGAAALLENFGKIMQEHELSLPALRPAARVLILLDEKAAQLAAERPKSNLPLARVTDCALTLGHRVQASVKPLEIDESAPEVVIFDGTVPETTEQIQGARAQALLNNAVFVVLAPPRTRGPQLEIWRHAGADDFLNMEATAEEIQTRLEGAVLLTRARQEIADLREQLARQTRVDEVTGVMSRRFFFQQAHRECSRARRYGHKFTCLMLEINHFKMLCSTYGEPLGEQVLRMVATFIGQWTRDSDLVARFGESKFAILLPETGIDGATSAREKILSALHAHDWSHEGHPFPFSVSVGEAELEPNAVFNGSKSDSQWSEGSQSEGDDGENTISTREALAGLLEDADAALYIARKGARIPPVFAPYSPAGNANAEYPPLVEKTH